MDLSQRAIALYGRFSPGVRDQLQTRILSAGGGVARDLIRRSDTLVIGALAMGLIDSGALATRLATAKARGVPTFSERAFAAALNGEPEDVPTVPLPTALAETRLTRGDAEILAALDLIALKDANTGFGDRPIIRTASDLIERGRSLADAARILKRAKDLSPRGRHKIVLTASGEAALQWQDGLSTLEGQGLLPLDEDHASVDELFEAAAIAEAAGDLDGAARLYDLCARADRTDAIAPYNLANIRLAEGDYEPAILAYQRALSRDGMFVEARYNLAQALEAAGKAGAALAELDRVLIADPAHADAVFNLAQLKMKSGDMAAAKALYERYLTLAPPPDWAAIARKAILYCATLLAP